MSTYANVHWHEGMFLRPQHFQLAEQSLSVQLRDHVRWSRHFCWGIRQLQLDEDALANQRVLIRRLAARMQDGTLISYPEMGDLPELDLRTLMHEHPGLTIFAAVPKKELRTTMDANNNRYRLQSVDMEDFNTGQNPRPIQLRTLNVRLLTEHDDHAGYATIPLFRVRKADQATGVPELDRNYIPPLLTVDAWDVLQREIVRSIYDRIGKKLELVSQQVISRGITFDSTSQGDRLTLEQLRVMNEAYAELNGAAFTPGVRPEDVFQQMARFIGRMAVFSRGRKVPNLPIYDHDDLGDCFWTLRRLADQMLDSIVEPEYSERAFVGAGQRIQVALEPLWLETGQRIYIAVTSGLPSDQTQRLVQQRLDLKLGASSSVDDLYRMGRAGLRFAYQQEVPRCLPIRPGRVFFRIDRHQADDQWELVHRDLSLAIRFNENLMLGNIQDRQSIDVKVDGNTVTLEFVLYVVPPSAI